MPIIKFKKQWLDCVVEGHPIREWCRCIKHKTGEARCAYCHVDMKFGTNGLKTFKRHALTNKHREKIKAAHMRRKTVKGFSGKRFKSKETRDALTLYPGMNFNCSVDLLPLSVLYKASKQVRNSDFVSFLRHLVKPESRNAFIDVYICFFCGEEFVSRPALHCHQKECGMKSPELPTLKPLGKSPVHQLESVAPPIPSSLCHSLEKDMSLPFNSANEQKITYPYVQPSKDSFISSLGLLPKKKAAQVYKRRRNTECEVIDLDEDIPISPTMPRTPKLLISHLSRDGNENCGELSSPNRVKKALFGCQHSRTEKEDNTKMEGSVENNEENKSEEQTKMQRAKSLYSLDLTSPLGQLVIKHVKGDPNLHVLSDVESHCLTSTPKTNTPTIQLRERHITFPVTFKGLFWKFSPSHIHQYKFTRQQKVEFMRRVNTGLDVRSRALLKKMKPCAVRLRHITKADLKKWMLSTDEVTVNLKPLSAEEIAYWTTPKEVMDTNCDTAAEFPSGLTFSSPNVNNVLGLKTCQDVAPYKKYNLSVANYVSEETFAEMTANRRTVYKSLLSDSNGGKIYLSELDNCQVSVPILRHILSSPCLHSVPPTEKQTLQGNSNSDLVQEKISSPPSFHSCQIDDNNRKEGLKHCNFLSSVNRDICFPKIRLIDSIGSASANLSNASDLTGKIVCKENANGEFISGPLRSGSHNVQIRLAFEGEVINSSVKYCAPVSSSDEEESLSSSENTKKRKTRKRKSVENKSLLNKSYHLSKQTFDSDTLHQNSSKFKSKKRKVDSKLSPAKVLPDGDSSVILTSTKKGQVASKLPASESAKKNLCVKIELSRVNKTVTNCVKSLSKDSIYSDTEKKQIPSKVLDADQTTKEPESAGKVAEGMSRQQKRVNIYKSVGFYKKLATVGSFGNCPLLNVNKGLSVQTNTNSCRFTHSKGRQKHLKVSTDENPGLGSMQDTISNERTEKNSSLMKKTHISHIINTSDVAEIRNIENRSVISGTIESISKKSIPEVQNSPVPSNSSSSSTHISQKDIASAGLRFVTYSSPVSPQLRQSSLVNRVSIPRKAEERKRLLSSFLLNSNGKRLGTLLIRNSLTNSASSDISKSEKDKFRHTLRKKEGK